jgi:transposase
MPIFPGSRAWWVARRKRDVADRAELIAAVEALLADVGMATEPGLAERFSDALIEADWFKFHEEDENA